MFSMESSPTSKRARLTGNLFGPFELDECVFCDDPLGDEAVKPDVKKLDNLFNACEILKDNVGLLLLQHQSEIVSQDISFRYHRVCRRKYIDRSVQEDECVRPKTRPKRDKFDWKTKCFVCSGKCSKKHRSTWSMVEAGVNEQKTMYRNLYDRAIEINDSEMLARLSEVPNGDLVAIEARYHRKACYVNYLVRNDKPVQGPSSAIIGCAIKKLSCEILPSIERKQIFLLSDLRKKFNSYLIGQSDIDITYTSRKLKTMLEQEWSDTVSFFPQPGESYIVCHKDISASYLLKKMAQLEDQDQSKDTAPEQTDEMKVHHAIGILRDKIAATEYNKDEYYSMDEVTVEGQFELIEPLLYKAICWLTDKEMYTSGSIPYVPDRKSLAIANDIIAKAGSVVTPKQLGLGVTLHHKHGSSTLIKEVHESGHSISYSETRRFVTNAAFHVATSRTYTPSGGLVPNELAHKDDGGMQPIFVGDNWDHNERTIDGKKTTHAMTSITLAASSGYCVAAERIPRAPVYSFDKSKVPGAYLLF